MELPSTFQYRVMNKVTMCTFMLLDPVGKSSHEREQHELEYTTLCSLMTELNF